MRALKKQLSKQRQPVLWLGYSFWPWFSLLARNRFAIHISRLPIALVVSIISLQHSALGLLERIIYGRRIARMQVHPAPIFILGHWRSGTTLLHELFDCDARFRCPTTYECADPHHFLITRRWIPRLFNRWLPHKRPMDNMAVGWGKPQEEEFALCLLGQPSPMEHVAFPNRHGPGEPALRVETLSKEVQRRWQATFMRFLRRLTIANEGKPIVLKSPPHTFRIPLLLELFPDARFIHIVRDPYEVFSSTLHLWRSLYAIHSLQRPTWRGLQEKILETFEAMSDRFEADRKSIPPGRLHEVRFEDLIADPLSQLEVAYRKLDLGDFEPARTRVGAYLRDARGYEQNRLMITPEERAVIGAHWARIFARQGYDM
jgi:omega-hydroxy-beta-dihydromenaquinone-9 sulfotransferase